MTPRNLRHRLEKAAKLLVTVQKHLPNARTQFIDDRGTAGQLVLFTADIPEMHRLGGELESKGFQFTRTHNPWLGVIRYRGEKAEQPTVIIEIETIADRLYRAVEPKPEPFSFRKN